jgi:fibronectin-binding autotransporter adhesin
MANVTITQLPAAGPIQGDELVPIVQNGQTLRTTAAALAGSPVQTQTFLTLVQEPTLNNSRYLSGGTGIGLQDNGAQSYLRIVLNGASGSLETASTGLIVKTGASTVTSRSSVASTSGLSVSDGDGVAGNPTIALTGLPLALTTLGGTGLLAVVGGATIAGRQILGTTDQITVYNGNGSDNISITLATNPAMPGTAAMTIPVGSTAQQPVGANGQFRFNSDTQTFDGYAAGSWRQFALSGGVTTFSGGSTGLTPATPTSGAVTLGGILNPASGGTGINNGSFTTTLGGNISTAAAFATSGAFSLTLTATASTNVTLPTTGTLATLAGAETLTNKTMSGASNTFSNIGNSSLTNSSVTYNGVTVALGASGTITATTTAALTVGTGLQLDSGTTFDGSTAKTISIDSTVATLTGTQTLTNKSMSGASNTFTNIPNGALSNSSITIGSTSVSLGGTAATVAGLTLTLPTIAQILNTGTLTLPTSTDTLVARNTTDTLTNKTISGSNNTLNNIGNGSLTNSTISFTYSGGISGSASVALGSSNALSLSNIPNSSLQNSAVTIGTTSISLGATSLTLAGLTSVTLTQDPVSALQAATKQYVDTLVSSGITYHTPVKYEVPSGNLTATYNNGTAGVGATLTNAGTLAAFTPDGVVASVNDRILIYNQTNQFENGVYTVTVVGDGSTAWVLTRATDADTYALKSPNGLGEGDAFFVTSGNTGAGETYVCNTSGTITFGTTAITFAQVSAAQVYSAGTGLTLTGTQFSLTSPVTAILGGTGQTSYATGDLLYASTSTALSKLPLGTQGYVLKAGAAGPEWGTISGGTF